MFDWGPPTLQEVAYLRIREPQKTQANYKNRIGMQGMSDSARASASTRQVNSEMRIAWVIDTGAGANATLVK